jgi:hypothetical protein
MKKAIFTILIAVSFLAGNAQLYNSGGNITVASGATLVVQGDYTSTGSGNIDIDGIVDLKGNFINNNTSGGIDQSSTGTLNFSGTSAQQISGSRETLFFGTLNINNSAGVSLTTLSTGATQSIQGLLNFTAGKLILNDFNLIISQTDPTGFDADEYIVTNGAGMVSRIVEGSDVIYPVGNSTFNPVTLSNNGLIDIYSVKVNDGTPAGWTGGDNHVVNRYWQVAETLEGGSDLAVTPQWNSSEEQAGFDRTDAAVGLTRDDGATFAWAASGASAGTDPYTRSGSNFTGPGTYMVGDYFYEGLELDLDFFLAGPYSGGTMSKTLNTLGYIPLTDPYGLGTEVAAIPANAVDWVKIQLRDKNTQALVYEFARFVDVNGNIMDLDGTSGISKIRGVLEDSYYIGVMHRNHLGVMSPSPLSLTSGSTAHNFTTAQSQAWQKSTVTTNPAMEEVGTNVFALFQGNAYDLDTDVKYNGTNNDRTAISDLIGTNLNLQLSGYYDEDVNLDGKVKYNGSNNDRTVISDLITYYFGANLNARIRGHLP